MAEAWPVVLISGWFALVLAGIPLFFTDHQRLAFKRRYYIPYSVMLVCMGAAALGVTLISVHGWWAATIGIPFAIWQMYRSIRRTRFCNTCARANVSRDDVYCGRCGASLPG